MRRIAATGALACATLAAALAFAAPAPAADILLVHGWTDHNKGANCNSSTWKNALDYYTGAGGRDRSSLTTVGYYDNDSNCDVNVTLAGATNETPIQDIAEDLAAYIYQRYTRNGRPVDVIAHSMGGLITRVALLGSAQGWDGFPPGKLDVNNVVTLSTPHGGIQDPTKHPDRQWQQMRPGSGFMKRLHAAGSKLGDAWADGTDWTLIGSYEDETVHYNSGIDKGNPADQKLGYQRADDGGLVDHQRVRTLRSGKYDLMYWHASGDHAPHHTTNGWPPLKAAFKAATRVGDGLPK
jgi:pimeloyl-ACP methyl ester carboxylesterase